MSCLGFCDAIRQTTIKQRERGARVCDVALRIRLFLLCVCFVVSLFSGFLSTGVMGRLLAIWIVA